MLSAIQIVRFLNQPFLQNKSMKQPHFLHVNTNSQKLKIDQKKSFLTAIWLLHGQLWAILIHFNLVKNRCGQFGVTNELMELTDVLYTGTISHKLKGD